MVLLEKRRQGAKAYRRYDTPKTPLKRIIERRDVPKGVKNEVRKYAQLNPVALKRQINECQMELIRMAAPKRAPLKIVKVRRQKEVRHTTPLWRRDSNPQSPNPFLERQRAVELRRAQAIVELKRKTDGQSAH